MRHLQSNSLPPASPACAAFADLLPLVAHGLLAQEDAERLKAHVATCLHCQAQLAAYDSLDALLREQTHAFAPFAPTLEETMNHIEDQQNPLPPPSSNPTPVRIPARLNRTVTVVALIAAILVVVLLAQALLSHLPNQTGIGTSVHPNATATFDSSAEEHWISNNVFPPVSQYPTPQQAYSVFGPARMCIHSTTLDQTETWLATSSILGVVLVQAHCSDGRAPVAWSTFVRTPNSPGGCGSWANIESSYSNSRPLPDETLPSNAIAAVPIWLNLPAGQYQNTSIAEDGSYDLSIRYGATVWFSATNIFIAMRFKGEAMLPPNLVSITIGERAGWYVTQDGMTTITVPLNGQEAYLFTGSSDIGTILPLATAALAHLDSLQPQMYDPGHSDVLACH